MSIIMKTQKKYIEPQVFIMDYGQQLMQAVSDTGHHVYPPTDPDEGDPGDGAVKWEKYNFWEDN